MTTDSSHALKPGTRVLVVGLGKTGLSCVRFLSSYGAEVAVTDSREHPPALDALREQFPDVAVFVGGFAPEAFAHAELLVVSPGVSMRESLIAESLARGIPVIGDIELFARFADAPVVAITGSNGKSTVTTLVGQMAQAAGRDVRVGGNLGTPALDLLNGAAPELYVLELSSFQLETTSSLNARAAAILNISEDHMDRYDDLESYVAAKARIYQGDGVMVVNADDPHVMLLASALGAGRQIVHFQLSAPAAGDYGVCEHNGEAWLCHDEEVLLPVTKLGISGWHNVANALAALALGAAVGLPYEAMCQALRSFTGLPHRSQRVAERDGVVWYNDSKGTNVGATLAAIRGMPGERVVLIAGGLGKGQDFTPLRAALAERGRAAVLIGRDAPLIEAALEGAVPVERAGDLRAAVTAARRLAQPGDVVLLSPACASFDMFKGYDDRGNVFVAAVQELLQ